MSNAHDRSQSTIGSWIFATVVCGVIAAPMIVAQIIWVQTMLKVLASG